MSAAARAIAAHGLTRRAFSLGAVKAFDQALQFLLPVVLVRCLDAATFGEYRLLWLAVGTVLTLACLGMPQALYYFVPRAERAERRAYVHQTFLYLGVAGLAAAAAVSPLNPWLPPTLAPLAKYGGLVPAFVVLWVTATLLDMLPTVEERIRLQAFATISTGLARTLLLAAGAWLTGDLAVMLWLLLAVVLFKLALLVGYIGRFHGWGRPWLEPARLAGQLRYAAPFGVSGTLYSLRGQADQWVAASLFALHSFAAFSIAALVGQVVQIFRTSVLEAFFPSMSRMEAAGDMRAAMEMNARANEMVGWALYPFLAFAFAFAEDLVSLVYTRAYVDAAPVMRVYIVGMLILVVELSSVMYLLRQGLFNALLNATLLGVSVAVSWTGGAHLGLAGAAAGSVAALVLDRLIILNRISRLTGVPVARLQRWGRLATLALAAAAAAALAWALVGAWLPGRGPLVRLLAGAALIALPYLAATWRRRA
ncbi:MAG TPA: oligosaccharide flippase family protein [Burkholderiales bacterium]